MVRKVLFVDDDEILQLAVEKRCAAHEDSFSIVLATDGFDALKKLENLSVSLIVVDLFMPRMDGMSLLTHVLELYPDIPVIMISTTSQQEMPHLAEVKGVVAYLEKPFRIDNLLSRIMTILQDEATGGIMHNVSPTMFLQLMEMEGKTCTIRILDNSSGDGGILYLQDGQMLDARVGPLRGIDAAYRIFSWDEVTVYIRNDCAPRENVINSELQPIIMGALAAKDEAEDSDSADSEGPLSGFSSLSDDDFYPGALADVESEMSAGTASDVAFIELETLLQKEVGKNCGLLAIDDDVSLNEAITLMTQLGESSGLGSLRVGYVENGKETERFLLAGTEKGATVLQVKAECPVNTILDVLRYRD